MADNGGVTILEEFDGPSEEEIHEYANYLGIDIENEAHLLWIAKEGVTAPVPAPWKACMESGEDVFYFNFMTGESTWDHPSDGHFRELVEKHRQMPSAPEAGKAEELGEGHNAGVHSSDGAQSRSGQDAAQPTPIASSGAAAGGAPGAGPEAAACNVLREESVPGGVAVASVGHVDDTSRSGATMRLPEDEEHSQRSLRGCMGQRGGAETRSLMQRSEFARKKTEPVSDSEDEDEKDSASSSPQPTPAQDPSRLKLISDEISDEDSFAGGSDLQSDSGGDAAQQLTAPAPDDRAGMTGAAAAGADASIETVPEPQAIPDITARDKPQTGAGHREDSHDAPRSGLPDISELLADTDHSPGKREAGCQQPSHADPVRSAVRDGGGTPPAEETPSSAAAERGLAGVGLAPASRAAGLDAAEARKDADGNDSEDDARDASETPSSPLSASQSGTRSRSGARAAPSGAPRRTVGQLEQQLEHSGQSGLSGHSGKGSSALSEISEDFPSESGAASPTASQEACGRTSPLGDTLELSATMDSEEPSAAAAASRLGRPSGGPAPVGPPLSAGHAGAKQQSDQGASAERGVAEVVSSLPKLQPTRRCGARLEVEVESLARSVAMLRDIRLKQQEYLRLLQAVL